MTEKCLTFMTFNLWGKNHWSHRQEAVRQLFGRYQPDILCVQEFSREAKRLLKKALPKHHFVCADLHNFEGWRTEGNIYWNTEKLKLAGGDEDRRDIGKEEVAIALHEGTTPRNRRLFWVRLKFKDTETDHTIFVSTAHLSFKNSSADKKGFNPRKWEMDRIISKLNTIPRHVDGDPVEPAFFMGDVNDTSPIFDLFGADFEDCFTGMNKPIPSTVPVFPKGRCIDVLLDREPLRSLSSDCIAANKLAVPREAEVPHFRYRNVAPSDHWPVWAEYELTWK